MKTLNIGGKDYTLEYTIGASLYDDCVVSVMNLLTSSVYAERGIADQRKALQEQLSVVGGIPKVTLTVFYAGLLEHHGTGEYAGDDSDETVESLKDAKRIIGSYLQENKDTGNGTWIDVLNLCTECMGDDGFLTMIGVDKMIEMQTPRKTTKKKTAKVTKITEA